MLRLRRTMRMDDEEEPDYWRHRMRREARWRYLYKDDVRQYHIRIRDDRFKISDDNEVLDYLQYRRHARRWHRRSPTRRRSLTTRSPIRHMSTTRSRSPDAGISSTADAEKLQVLDAVERAKALRLCLRRIWAVAASLPDKENSLPGLIPVPGTFFIPGHDRERHEHEQCTFDFCEQSRIDFTSVAQHHETPCHGKCDHITFPLELLNERVANGKPTAWRLDEPSLLEASHPYMAVSHVWSDGTGSGIWGPGKVNKCLYTFFSSIARSFQCKGCWWDSISIPLDDQTRTKALSNMHTNYNNSRITLVHDLYLREWEWVDSETACFAIVMSPWYSRGWTALELAQSHKVKILFKAKNDTYVIKDLDVDILAEVPENHSTANSIRKLRHTSINEFGTLLAILGARDTSKPRDVPIISGLLAGVDVSGSLSQQEIYQRILRKLGRIAQGHLFHNSATMSAPGFSWCPTNILDMPMAEIDSMMLELHENGDLEGEWRVQAIDSVKVEELITRGTHPLTQVSLESAFRGENMEKHVLLLENNEPKATSNDRRALLVKLMASTEEIAAKFVGPVYFRANPTSGKQKGVKPLQIRVRIGSTDGLKEVPGEAWSYIQKSVTEKFPMDETPATNRGRPILKSDAPPNDDGDFHRNFEDWRAIFFTEGVPETAGALLDDESRIPPSSKSSKSKSQDDMAMFFYRGSNLHLKQPPRAFFYGNNGMVHSVRTWLGKNPEVKDDTGRPILLALGNDNEVKMDLKPEQDDDEKNSLAGKALLLATEKDNQSGVDTTALVTLLLDIKAPHHHNASGQQPLHIALECGNYRIAERLLRNESSPASVDAKAERKQTALHLAAKQQYTPKNVSKLLVQRSKHVDAQDETLKRTALHYAAENGNVDMARELLNGGADTSTPDSKRQVALHFAASKGFDEIVRLLLEHTRIQALGSESKEVIDVPGEHINRTTEGDTNGVTGQDSEEEAAHETDEKVDRVVTGVDGTSGQGVTLSKLREHEKHSYSDIKDSQEQTPLHLAAEAGHESVVSTLLDSEANPCAMAVNGQTPLLLAAKSGQLRVVKRLLKSSKHCFQQEELDNALLLAAVEKNEPVINELHKNGARSNRLQISEGMTALHWTLRMGFVASAKLLIQSQDQADIDFTDEAKKQSALLMASEKGLTSVVTLLLGSGADINLKDSKERTALHLAAMGPYNETVIELLKEKWKCPVNEQDYQKRTALHLAALSQSTDVTDLIVQRPLCHHNDDDEDGRTALVIAAEMGLEAVVTILLKGGSDPTRGENGRTAFERAAALGYQAVVQEMLPKIEADGLKKRALELAAKAGHLSVAILLHESIKDADPRASTLRTILFAAAANPGDETVPFEDLLGYVTDPNIQDDKGRSLLMLAIENRHRSLARHLLHLRLKTDLTDNEDKTALMVAAIKNDADIVRRLLYQGANPDLGDKAGYTALHYAVENGCFSSFVELLGGSHKTIQDSQKRSALHIALEKIRQLRSSKPGVSRISRPAEREVHTEMRMEMCEHLIAHGIRLEIQDKNGRNALHLAVAQNLEDIAEMLLESSAPHQYKMDTEDVENQTPLLLAAANGYTSLVGLMLSHGFKSDTKAKNGQTPLLLTAERGDDESVEALLDHGADPNLQNKHGRTALSQAAQNGHKDVVDSLLCDRDNHKTNLNARDSMGRTALILAAENGYVSIVKTLVHRSANADIVGYDGKKAWQKAVDKGHASVVKTLLSNKDAPIQDRRSVNEALLLASRRGWVDLVRVLLEQEVDLTSQSIGDKWTALHMAAMSGHREVLEILIAKGVDIVIKDRDGRTALFQATEQGFESIVGLLLKRKEIKTDIDAWMGQESLLFAAEKGYDGIVELLLDSGVDFDATDASDRSAMVLAAANGKEAIVKMLLERGARWASKDKDQRTALHHAAWGGHHKIVEILLAYKGPVVEGGSVVDSSVGTALVTLDSTVVVDSSVVDNGGQSALHLAAERASIQAVERLVEKRANVNAKCKDGQTVLHRAAWGGSCEVVRLLRKSGADPFIRDNQGKKPWHIAAEKGHDKIAVELLGGEESVHDEHILDQKGLIFAAKMGYTSIARCLLRKNAEATVKDKYNRTPLHWAAARGDKDLAKLLIDHGEVPINAVDHKGRTALCLAVLDDHTAAVEILLQCGLDANIRDTQGQTALHHAAQKGTEEIAQILVDHDADPHIHDNDRRKAWQLAAEEGYHQVARLLLKKEIDLSPHNQRREELFLKMSERNLVPMVQLLLEMGVDINVKDRLGRTAIGLAAEHGADDVVRLLLFKGADPNIADFRRQTPLLWAAKAGNAKIISLLLERIGNEFDSIKGAETVNHEDAKGRTALVIAIEKKHDKTVKLLLEKCKAFINVDVQDKTQRTALHLAAEMGNINWVQLLLNNNAEQGHKDSLGRTALLLAAEQGDTEVVKALLSSTHRDVNVADNQDRTPLQAATDRGSRDIVAALLKAGADPGMALLLAAEHGDNDIVGLLLENKAAQNFQDKDKRTPLLVAVANGDKAIVEALLNHPGFDPDARDARDRTLLHLAVESGNRDVAWLVAKMVTSQQLARQEGE